MIALAALIAEQALAGPLTVAAVRAHLHEWNGRQVAVHGWKYGCEGQLAHPCYIVPSSQWRQGRGRLRLAAAPGLTDGFGGRVAARKVVVHGTIETFQCGAGTICLDGEDVLRVDAIKATAPLTVAEVRRRYDDLVNRRVQLRGWLQRESVHLECALYTWRADDRAMRVLIGTAPAFYAAVREAVGHETIVEATVTNRCWPSSGVRCLDRGDQLADPQFLRVLH